MDKFFGSVFSDGTASTGNFFLSVGVALIVGIVFAFMCYYKTKSSKSFFITTALLPASVAVVIILVNGNIGAGIAVAGAFSLVRFRSAPGNAKEICIIFISMAAGLSFGMGYLAYGAIFALIAGGILILLSALNVWEKKPDFKEKRLCVTIPEGLDYCTVFDDLLETYTSKHELVKVKSVNMGSMFRLTYNVTLKDNQTEKQFIDELRCRNGNLEIYIERMDVEKSEL
ncbi:MAG: DUF4956 domain-containing protein [Christensenellales bacterium]